MPTINEGDETVVASRELVEALQNFKTEKSLHLTPSHYDSLTKLACIFNEATEKKSRTRESHFRGWILTYPQIQ